MPSSTIQWHHSERGDPDKPGILFLHGFMGNCGIWAPVIDSLCDRYHCVALDLPGHGATTVNTDDLNFSNTARQIVKLSIEKFSHPPVICGYSMGGRIALHTALNYPDLFKGMIIESANPGIEIEHERRKRFVSDRDWADKLSQSSMKEFLIEWYSQAVFSYLPDDLIARIIEKKSNGDPTKLAMALIDYSQGLQQPLWRKLPQWEKPALIIAGQVDKKYCEIAERMVEVMLDAELCLVPDAGHIVHLEKRDRFIAVLKSWLDSRIL